MADEQIAKLNNSDKARKLTLVEQEYMKLIAKKNTERVIHLKHVRRNNTITGLLLGAAAFSIYGYSIYAVRQESFLDDFNEPEKTTE